MQTQRVKGTEGDRGGGGEQEGIIVWDKKGIVVVWPDGHRTRLPWAAIRQACQCAQCREQRETPVVAGNNATERAVV